MTITGYEPNPTLVSGIAIVGYGVYVLGSSIAKMDAVKERWQSKKQDVIYVFIFIAASILSGGFLIVKGLDKYNLNFF